MATCFCGVRPFGQLTFFNIIMRNVRKQQVCHRNYTKRARKRKQTIQEEGKIDIGGILSGSGESSGNKLVPGNNAAAGKSSQDTAVKAWQNSQERASLLRKGEKRWAKNFKISLITCSSLLSLNFILHRWNHIRRLSRHHFWMY